MAMKDKFIECLPMIDKSLEDEFDFLAGCNPIWIVKWLTGDKYHLVPRQRIVISPNTKEELIEWAKSDAFSSNCLSLEKYMNGEASEEEMLQYVKEIIRNIEYQTNKESLAETLRCAKWCLGDIKLEIKELTNGL